MLERREFVRRLLVDRGDLLVVSGLGSATYDVAAAGDHALNFYLWGAMGGTAMIGLGLALARPERRVAVITGDGDMLMGIGSLATIGVKQPRNLAIVVLDNAQLRRNRHAAEPYGGRHRSGGDGARLPLPAGAGGLASRRSGRCSRLAARGRGAGIRLGAHRARRNAACAAVARRPRHQTAIYGRAGRVRPDRWSSWTPGPRTCYLYKK